MKRHAIMVSLMALVLVPDWASAFGLRRCGFGSRLGVGLGQFRGGGLGLLPRGRVFISSAPIACPPPVVYSPPVYYYSLPPVVVPCPPPSYAQPVPAVSAPEKPKSAAAPKVEAIPSGPAMPARPSTPKQPEIKPADLQRPEVPPAAPKLPMPGIPEKRSNEPSAGLVVPEVEPMELPGRPPVGPLPTIPVQESKPEVKKPEENGPKLPPLTPSIPGSNSIPPLSIPGVGEAERIAKSSPFSSPPPVNIYWVEGDVPDSPRAVRKVNFFNQTEADVQLTVEGRTTKLPKKHFLEVEVPPTFRWKYADYPEQVTEIPLASPGAEIVLRRPKL